MISVRQWLRPAFRMPLVILLLGGAVVGLLWAAGAYEAHRDMAQALDQAERDTAGYALAFRENVRRAVTAIDQVMLAVKAEYAQDPEHYRLPTWVKEAPVLAGLAFEVALVGPDGRIRQSSLGASRQGADLSRATFFREQRDGTAPQPAIAPPEFDATSERWSMAISRRLSRADGSFGGVLLVAVDPLALAHFFETVDLGSDGAVTLIGADGIIRARRATHPVTSGRDLGTHSIFAPLLGRDHGTVTMRSRLDGIERIYSFASVPEYGLMVVVGEGRDAVLKHARGQRNHFLMIEAVVSLFVLLLVGILLAEALRRQRREQALADQAALLGTILDVNSAALWVKDEAGRFILLNDATARLLGRPSAAVLGHTTPDLLPSDVASKIQRWDGAARLQPGAIISGEHERMIGGEPRHYLTFRRTCEAGGRVLLVGSGVDVTPLRQAEAALRAEMAQRETAEAQLRQAQKMEMLGQLTGGIAHDFNNLLTTVLGNLELAARQERDADQRRLLYNATRAAERGATLIQHLLAFARRQHLDPAPLDLNGLILEAKEMLDRTLGPAVQIATVLDSALWPALADANQVEVALLNVAINARDAMPEGGRLLIRTANIAAADPDRPPELRPGDFVEIAIVDSGEGMEPEVLARAFDPFFTTKEVGKGSGLGLSQVYGMAQQSGGMAWLESGRGEGTTVRIYLPRALPPSATARDPRPAATGMPRQRPVVLVADDDDQIREFLVLCLADQGYEVVAAADGLAALAAMEGRRVDLAILDIVMPGIAGPELARVMRERQPGLPVLFMTGFAGARVLEQAGDAPILRKPFGSAKLLLEVRSLLARRAPDGTRAAEG